MNTQDKDMEVVHTSAYNPFPEPQTIPSGWDLSELVSTVEPCILVQDKPAPVAEVDGSEKVKSTNRQGRKTRTEIRPALELTVSK